MKKSKYWKIFSLKKELLWWMVREVPNKKNSSVCASVHVCMCLCVREVCMCVCFPQA